MVVALAVIGLVALVLLLSFLDHRHQRKVDAELRLAALQHAKSPAEALGIIATPRETAEVVRNSSPEFNRIVTKDGRVLEEVSFENLH